MKVFPTEYTHTCSKMHMVLSTICMISLLPHVLITTMYTQDGARKTALEEREQNFKRRNLKT